MRTWNVALLCAGLAIGWTVDAGRALAQDEVPVEPKVEEVEGQPRPKEADGDQNWMELILKPLGLDLDEEQGRIKEPSIPFVIVSILGAILTGLALAYHPHYVGKVAGLVEMDSPKIIVTYTVAGALVASVVKSNPIMGAVVFGLGGLMRFRTELPSAKDTGRVILAVLIGIGWGLALVKLAVVATVIAWILIFILDWHVAYRMVVRGLDAEQLAASAASHQTVLENYGCRITQVKKNLRKSQFSIVFKSSRKYDRDDYEAAFADEVEESLQGTVDWPEAA